MFHVKQRVLTSDLLHDFVYWQTPLYWCGFNLADEFSIILDSFFSHIIEICHHVAEIV